MSQREESRNSIYKRKMFMANLKDWGKWVVQGPRDVKFFTVPGSIIGHPIEGEFFSINPNESIIIEQENWKGCFKIFKPCCLNSHLENLNCSTLKRDSEKAIAPHSSTLALKIPWTEEPGRLQCKEVDKTERLHFHFSLPNLKFAIGVHHKLACIPQL